MSLAGADEASAAHKIIVGQRSPSVDIINFVKPRWALTYTSRTDIPVCPTLCRVFRATPFHSEPDLQILSGAATRQHVSIL